MTKILTSNKNYYDIADTIRQMKNVNTTYKPREMASALKDIYSNEVEGTLPLSFQANGNNLLNYRIDGASGGVGDKTNNLFDLKKAVKKKYINSNGNEATSLSPSPENTLNHSDYVSIDSNVNYTFTCNTSQNYSLENTIALCWFDQNKNILSRNTMNVRGNINNYSITALSPSTAKYLIVNFIAYVDDAVFYLNEGTTTVFEPYGYKVPVVVKRKAKHTATLQLHDCLPTTMMFDAPEALYYAENGLVAGTYCFTIQQGYDTAYGGGKTYNFTLTEDVEPGGQLTFNWAYNTQASNSKITSYKSDVFTVIESNISVAEGSAGTSLGTTDGNSLNLNHIHRVRFGSNNYVQGAIRQFLNSSENVGSVWQPQTKFDRPPTWNSEMSGFLRDLDSNFLAFVGISRKVVGINNPTDGGGYVTFEDKFFLLSRSEVYGGNESVLINEGEPYPYYSNYSDLSTAGTGNDTNRIKNRNGSAQVWGLRTVITSSASHLRTVNTSGGIGNIYANNKGDGVAPACNIEIDEDYKYNDTILNVGDQISVLKGSNTLVFDVIGIDVDEEVYFESETTNIYLDEPISENESVSLSDTNVNIPTIRGTNVLTVDTTVQPSNVYVKARKESPYEITMRQRYESIIADYEQQLASIESLLQEV